MFTNIKRINAKRLLAAIGLIFALFSVFRAEEASAATLSLNPASGTYTVGSTFDVIVSLNTESQSINALRIFLSFPPDKLQLVPGQKERSIITVYSSPPRFDNQAGIVDMQGGIPGGINVSNGHVIKFTFRVKAVGTAIIRFSDKSQVLANDGLGTNILKNTQNGLYELVLPPPLGPVVVSASHHDQAAWYANPTVFFTWSGDEPGVENYSYVLNDEPIDIPDDIAEGLKTSVTYKNIADGTHYFHIKSFRRGNWGGTTHFAVNIDSTPPAEFPIEIVPGPRTTRIQPVIQFSTTDNLSGLDYYELKIIFLTSPSVAQAASQPLFIEAQSPYVTSPLEKGSYHVIIRAFDKAGNFREAVQELKIVSAIFRPISGEGLELRGRFVIPWFWFWIISGIIFTLLVYFSRRLKHWHDQVHMRRAAQELPSHISSQLEELKKFRRKYGKIAILFLVVFLGLGYGSSVSAQTVEFPPPFVSTVSRDISNEEIFYVGGKTDVGNIDVIIYVQNLQSGETISRKVTSDKNGDWFYTHDSFLGSGSYLLWSQSKAGEQLSPPSPQIQMQVRSTAIQFGASRISTELLYLIFVLVLLAATAGLLIFIIYHVIHGRKKHKLFLEEVRKAEESVRRGFAVLRRDIEAELDLIKEAKLRGKLSKEQRAKEDQMLKDLNAVEEYVEKEIWEIEKTET